MNSWDRLCATFWGWLIVSAMVLLVATAVVDGQGAKENNHAQPLPAGVHQGEDQYAWVVEEDAHVPASTICRDAHGGVDYYSDAYWKGVHFIGCASHQTWNDRRPRSINFAHAFGRVTGSTWYGPLAFTSLLFLLAVSPLPEYVRERNRRKRGLTGPKEKPRPRY